MTISYCWRKILGLTVGLFGFFFSSKGLGCQDRWTSLEQLRQDIKLNLAQYWSQTLDQSMFYCREKTEYQTGWSITLHGIGGETRKWHTGLAVNQLVADLISGDQSTAWHPPTSSFWQAVTAMNCVSGKEQFITIRWGPPTRTMCTWGSYLCREFNIICRKQNRETAPSATMVPHSQPLALRQSSGHC